jgi:hypothetical protein
MTGMKCDSRRWRLMSHSQSRFVNPPNRLLSGVVAVVMVSLTGGVSGALRPGLTQPSRQQGRRQQVQMLGGKYHPFLALNLVKLHCLAMRGPFQLSWTMWVLMH